MAAEEADDAGTPVEERMLPAIQDPAVHSQYASMVASVNEGHRDLDPKTLPKVFRGFVRHDLWLLRKIDASQDPQEAIKIARDLVIVDIQKNVLAKLQAKLSLLAAGRGKNDVIPETTEGMIDYLRTHLSQEFSTDPHFDSSLKIVAQMCMENDWHRPRQRHGKTLSPYIPLRVATVALRICCGSARGDDWVSYNSQALVGKSSVRHLQFMAAFARSKNIETRKNATGDMLVRFARPQH